MGRTSLATIDISELKSDGDTVSFHYDDAFGREQAGFVVQWAEELHAYRNLCPHWSTPLDDDGNGVFDRGSGALICKTHGALFEPGSGDCLSGPCYGEKLQKLRVERGESGNMVDIYRAGISLSGSV